MRQIVVAFERQSNCERVRAALEGAGEFSCLICRSAAQVRRMAAERRPELVVCGFKLADESCEALYYDLPQRCPMLMVAPRAQLDLCAAPGIYKLPAPVGRSELLAAARLLGQGRGGSAQRTEEERALIERAKSLLMEGGMTEEQAHRFLQKQSMNHGARLADTARRLLEQAQPGKDA